MSTELKPCPFCGGTNIDPAEWSQNDGKSGPGCGDCGALGESVEAWNRRTAPVSAPLDTQALPPLPKCVAYGVVALTGLDPNDGHRQLSGVSVGKPGAWARNSLVELYTANQYRQGQIELIAPYAERIRQLERELAGRKPASISGDPKFLDLLNSWIAQRGYYSYESSEVKKAWSALIAYIDGNTAGTAPEAVELCDLIVAKVRVFGEGVGFQDARLNILKKLDGKPIYAKASDLVAAAPSSMSKGKEKA